MTVVVAAGNTGKNLSHDFINLLPDNTTRTTPLNLEHVIFVAATNENHSDLLNRPNDKIKSSYGDTIVHIAARGESILTTSAERYFRQNESPASSPLYHKQHGTSLAVPRVVAALNYIKNQWPHLNAQELVAAFLDNQELIDAHENLSTKIKNGRRLLFGEN